MQKSSKMACATQVMVLLCSGCQGCGREWYIDEKGCAVGKVTIHNMREFDEVSAVTCFRDELLFQDFPPQYFTHGLLADVQEIGSLVVHMGDDARRSTPNPEANGRLVLSSLESLDKIAVFSNGIVTISLPLVTTINLITLSENIDLERISFDALNDITDSILLSRNPKLSFAADSLMHCGNPEYLLGGMRFEGDGPEEIHLPALERVDGGMYIIVGGERYIDDNGNEQWTGGVIDMPRLTTVNGWISIGGWVKQITMPLLKSHRSHMEFSIRVVDESGISDFGLEEAGSILWWGSTLPDGTNVLPHIRTAASIWLTTGNSVKRLYLPSLEDLGSLILERCWALREISLPSLRCLGQVETVCYFPESEYCLLPAELDDEIALSRANGCEPQVNICDPRNNPYHPYDEQWCLEQVP